jgi:hypothetical protein
MGQLADQLMLDCGQPAPPAFTALQQCQPLGVRQRTSV